MKRYNIVLAENRGGFASSAMAHNVGSVVSTVSAYDGERDLAVIDVPDEEAADFEAALDADENVVEYREVYHPSWMDDALG